MEGYSCVDAGLQQCLDSWYSRGVWHCPGTVCIACCCMMCSGVLSCCCMMCSGNGQWAMQISL